MVTWQWVGLGALMALGCASNPDCPATDYCAAQVCVGAGRCTRRDAIVCMDDGSSASRGVCGCDGRTYRDQCEAARVGVRVAVYSPCGSAVRVRDPDAGMQPLIGCAAGSVCPRGLRCCPVTNACVDPACEGCCAPPPAGTRVSCADNSTCFGEEYCAGAGCGPAGGCVSRPSYSSCGSVVEQVCGCDGRTYSNPCWAAVAGVRVIAIGACRGT